MLDGIRNLYQECENRHPMQRNTSDVDKLRARRDFYECLISRLEKKGERK